MLETAFYSYAALMSLTPGPNNLMLASSGVNHGFRKTIPHILGITTGVSLMLVILSATLGSLSRIFSDIRPFLAVAGGLYLLWLAWKTALARGLKQVEDTPPLGFRGALAFQALNPKVWVMCTNTALLFLPADMSLPAALGATAGSFAVINLACISLWAFAGDRLRRLFSRPAALRTFNIAAGLAMAATAVWLVAEAFLSP